MGMKGYNKSVSFADDGPVVGLLFRTAASSDFGAACYGDRNCGHGILLPPVFLLQLLHVWNLEQGCKDDSFDEDGGSGWGDEEEDPDSDPCSDRSLPAFGVLNSSVGCALTLPLPFP